MDKFARDIIVRLSKATAIERQIIVAGLGVANAIGTVPIEEGAAIIAAGQAAKEVRDSYMYLECPVCGWVDREGGDEYCPCGERMFIREAI